MYSARCITAALVMSVLYAVGAQVALPAYQPNPNYIRSSTLVSLPALRDSTLVGPVVVTPSDTATINYVTLAARNSKSVVENGILKQEDATSAYRLTTKSRCSEIQPGCLTIKEVREQTTVSVRSPL